MPSYYGQDQTTPSTSQVQIMRAPLWRGLLLGNCLRNPLTARDGSKQWRGHRPRTILNDVNSVIDNVGIRAIDQPCTNLQFSSNRFKQDEAQ